jgi:4-hydroxy-tetrahydrodipicolinate synthase
VYQALAGIPNIAGVKEATGSISKIVEIVATCGESLPVWSGNDDMTVPVMSLGGMGVISVVSNVAPLEVQDMCLAALAGDFDTAAALQCELMPLTAALFSEVNPIPVKAAMSLIGYDCGSCRPPLSCASTRCISQLNALLT